VQFKSRNTYDLKTPDRGNKKSELKVFRYSYRSYMICHGRERRNSGHVREDRLFIQPKGVQ
jgi:hypothetical protein